MTPISSRNLILAYPAELGSLRADLQALWDMPKLDSEPISGSFFKANPQSAVSFRQALIEGGQAAAQSAYRPRGLCAAFGALGRITAAA